MVSNKLPVKLNIPVISRLGERRKRAQLLKEEEERATQALRSQQRRNSVFEAKDFIRDFVKEGWIDYWDSTRIICSLTMPELRALGYLPQHEGTKACRKLVSIPVIYDEIGNKLWKKLAAMAQNQIDGDRNEQEFFERQTADAHIQASYPRRGATNIQIPFKQSEAPGSKREACEAEHRGCIFCGDGSLKHGSLPASIREEPYIASNEHCWSNPEDYRAGLERITVRGQGLQERRPSASRSFSEKFNVVIELGTKTISIFSENLANGYGYRNAMLDRTHLICLDAEY